MENYAIVVGIDDYHERPLQGAVNDAKAFADWLQKSGQISKSENIKLITSKEFPGPQDPPTDVEINRAVGNICKAALQTPERSAGRLYFYFSGHGLGLTFTNTALCMRPWSSFFNTYCISSREYLDGLAQLCLFKEIFFFFDCCRDVDVLANASGPRWNQVALNNVNTNYLVCFSTKFSERSQEIEVKEADFEASKKRGAFTKFLLDALNGDASDANGNIRAFELIGHLYNHFKSYTTTLRYVQEVEIHHNFGNNNILITQVGSLSSSFNYEITFGRNSSNVQLKDGSLAIIKEGKVMPGDIWKVNLPVGLNVIVDMDTQHEKYLQNHNTKTVSYEQF